jgi:aconitase A
MIGTDSHTVNAGGLGMVAIGVWWCRCSGCNVRNGMGLKFPN